MLKILEEQELEQVEELKKEGKVILNFFATWCMPCKMVTPVIEEIGNNTDIKVIRIDIDKFDKLAIENGIVSVPTFIAYEDGKELNRISGVQSKQNILDLFN
ncbi:MAG: thioredoxin family protein [Clostridium sp.]